MLSLRARSKPLARFSSLARSETLESRRLLTIEAAAAAVSIDSNSELVIQSVAAASVDGGSPVVVYSDRDSATGKGKDVFFRRFNTLGVAQGAAKIVNSTTSGAQMNPDVAINAAGNFVVVWQSEAQDGSSWGVYARRFNAAGVAQGGEILVNTSTSGAQTSPKVAIDSAGNFVVVYVNEAFNNGEVIFRRFQANGTPIAEATASGAGSKAYSAPVIAMKPDGVFAIAWVTTHLDIDNSTDIESRVYSASGSAVGSTQAIDDTGDQAAPSITAGASFFIAWSDAQSGEATISYRKLATTGAWSGTARQANQDSLGNRTRPSIAADALDNVFLGWTQQEQNVLYTSGVYRSFAANGSATSNEIAVTDGSSARTVMGVVFTQRGSFFELSTLGEFVGYGISLLTPMNNVIRFTGGSGADELVAYDLNATTLRTKFNTLAQDYPATSYAKVVAELLGGDDAVYGSDASIMFTISGGDGNDTIFTGSGYDSISGGDGNDSITTGDGSDYAIGNGGSDTLRGEAGDDTLTGGAGKDLMYGGDGADRLAGSGSPDQIFGEGGDDRLYGEAGDDWLDGGGGKDREYGGDGADFLIGGSSNDRLFGQDGNDTLVGNKGNDYLAGDAGIDTVLGKEPGDTVIDVEVLA